MSEASKETGKNLLTKEQFEKVKLKQLEKVVELQRELNDVQRWAAEFKKLLLDEKVTQEQVFRWSIENDIEKDLHHIRLK